MTTHVLFVCKSCAFSKTERFYGGERGGFHLLDRLSHFSQNWSLKSKFSIQEVECLSACNRSCVVVFAAPNKTTLMFGDLPPLQSAPEILKLAEQYHASTDGIVPRKSRPECLQKSILARIPPLPR
ncbi:DUF1636 family protein [Phormidesmis priestleyi]